MKKLRILTHRNKKAARYAGFPADWRALPNKSVVRAKVDMHYNDDTMCEKFFTKGKYYLVDRKIENVLELADSINVTDDHDDEIWVDDWCNNFELIL